MKKILILLITVLFIPMCVNAKSHYLYNVLKNEAENNGLAIEFTDEHQDSFTQEPFKKIYHWYSNSRDESITINNKNNVIFGDYCWQMYRTTDTGGVKLIYNGPIGDVYNRETLTKNDYEFLSSSTTMSWNEEEKVYETTITDSLRNEYLFKVPEGRDYYLKISATGTGSGTGYLYINDVSISGTGGSFSFYDRTIGRINADDILKFTFMGTNIDSSTPRTLKFKMERRGNKIGENGCGNTGEEAQIGTSSFNPNGDSPAYFGYMYDHQNITTSYDYPYLETGSIFGADVIYQDDQYILQDTSSSIDNSHHYTCNNTTGTCSSVRFYYTTSEYVILNNGKKMPQALDEMINNDDINKNDSTIKTMLENWYENNLLSYSNYLESIVFCNKREASSSNNGWKPEGFLNTLLSIEDFQGGKSIKCNRVIDQFSTENNMAKLKYPIGLIINEEKEAFRQTEVLNTGTDYWTMTPEIYRSTIAEMYYVNSQGSTYGAATSADDTKGVRPVVSLKNKIKYISGDGSKLNPYVIDYNDFYSVDVEINNETEDLTVEINDLTKVKEGETVNFNVTPIKGYKVTSIKIVDEDNNEVEYTTTNNKKFTFTMPQSDVTIIPSYEKVKNAVNVEDNKNTKEIIIEVNDSQAVVYEDTVRFKVEPEEGYEVDNIDITDEEENKISYRETNTKNEYEFKMPDTDVTIKPQYKKIESNSNSLPNPNTKRQVLFIVVAIMTLIVITCTIKKKRLN